MSGHRLLNRAATMSFAALLALALALPASARSLIRDADIEYALARLAQPLIAAAGINPARITVLVINDDEMTAFENSERSLTQVLKSQLKTGRNDYILRVVAQSAEDYEATHHRIARLPGVETIQSSLSLRTIKPWPGLPVPQPKPSQSVTYPQQPSKFPRQPQI